MTALLALGLLEILVLGVLARVPGAAGMPWPGLGLWALAFGVYGLAAWRLSRLAGRSEAAAPGRESGRAGRVPGSAMVLWIWALGVLARLVLLPLPPVLSDDLYRYVWDGWTQLQGLNPFAFAPVEAVERLGPLAGISDRINHPEIRTIYPAAAQLAFAALAAVSPTVLAFKAAFVAADLGVAWVVWRLAGRTRRGRAPVPPLALLLYLWCPLPIVEVAWSGHLEPLAILPMMAAILVAGQDPSASSRLGSGVLLGLGAAVKWLPALGFPALARRAGARAAAAGLAALGLLTVPFLDPGARLGEGLHTFARHWEFNPGAFELLEGLLGSGWPPRVAAGAVVGAVAVGAALRGWTLERALYWALGAALLLTPTLHPWYALWILPLAALREGRVWILFAGLVALGYWGRDAFLATGAWPRPPGVAVAVHGPLALGLLWNAMRVRSGG